MWIFFRQKLGLLLFWSLMMDKGGFFLLLVAAELRIPFALMILFTCFLIGKCRFFWEELEFRCSFIGWLWKDVVFYQLIEIARMCRCFILRLIAGKRRFFCFSEKIWFFLFIPLLMDCGHSGLLESVSPAFFLILRLVLKCSSQCYFSLLSMFVHELFSCFLSMT